MPPERAATEAAATANCGSRFFRRSRYSRDIRLFRSTRSLQLLGSPLMTNNIP
jgi:hypothetical protein